MSSMLKKGTGAFKPRAPIARRRPAAPAAAAPPVTDEPTEESQPTTPSPQENTPEVPLPVVATSSTAAEQRSAHSSPAVETIKSPKSRPDAPATEGSAVTKAKKVTVSKSTNAQPAATTSDVTPPGASGEPAATTTVPSRRAEKQADPIPAQDSTDGTATASATATAARTTAPPTSRKATSAGAKPSQPAAFTKPRPIAETTEPEPPSARQTETVPAPPASEIATPTTDNGEGSSTPAAPKAAAPKKARRPAAPRQPRKRKTAAGTGESEAETGAETEGPAKKKRAPRKKKDAATTNGGEGETQASGAENGEAAAPKKRAPRKKKKVATDQAATDVEENGERDGEHPVDEEGEETDATRKLQARRKRSVTPEDAEQQTVDHEQMVMSDLTRDLRIGAKFSKYDELRERIRKKRARQRLIKLGKLQPGEELPEGEDGGSEAGTPGPDSSKPAPTPKPVPIVDEGPSDAGMPRLVMRDGQLTLDEGTTQYDRHAAADAARGVVYEQEEDEFTTPVTQATYMRRQPQGNFWTDEETVKFYHGLRMFGTDFNTISKMFGGAKNRRQVKLKFNREERANPVAVNKCIIGEKVVPMALEAVDGADALEDSKVITDELDRLKEEQEAETRRQEEDKAAENQRRRDELFGKRKGDKSGARDEYDDVDKDDFGNEGGSNSAAKDAALHPSAMYGVGTDPDVIDETDLPSASARGKGRGRGGRGRRGGKSAPMFAGGIGA
ncbi:Transcription factor TFIIIB component B'' [Cytospora mali]|uniref:Transcription factor TFIIIB component B n=1 Tax=Cytospora mali TaxID=578113 RepID=A0A194V6S2_CYTMA|nr:Transcription factor TFIIIB component B'' [Valsa mali var. pyri (nom. inval.)]